MLGRFVGGLIKEKGGEGEIMADVEGGFRILGVEVVAEELGC